MLCKNGYEKGVWFNYLCSNLYKTRLEPFVKWDHHFKIVPFVLHFFALLYVLYIILNYFIFVILSYLYFKACNYIAKKNCFTVVLSWWSSMSFFYKPPIFFDFNITILSCIEPPVRQTFQQQFSTRSAVKG